MDPLFDKTIELLGTVSIYSFLAALALGGFVLIRKAVAKRREKQPARPL